MNATEEAIRNALWCEFGAEWVPNEAQPIEPDNWHEWLIDWDEVEMNGIDWNGLGYA